MGISGHEVLKTPLKSHACPASLTNHLTIISFRGMQPLRLFAFLLLGYFLLVSCSRKPETLTSKYDEKKMEQAIAEAQSTFPEFLTRLHAPQPGDEDFHVKVRIEDKHGVEHFWVSDLKLDSEPYSGKIADEPGIVEKVKFGQDSAFRAVDQRFDVHGQGQDARQLHVTSRVGIHAPERSGCS